MPAYNFQKQFADLVESGQKCQTIRQTARGATVGATAYFYTGQRTANCRKLGEGKITGVYRVEIGKHDGNGEPYAHVYVNRIGCKQIHLVHNELDAFAKDDGFANGEEMVKWFDNLYGLPFNGYLHQWEPRPKCEVTT